MPPTRAEIAAGLGFSTPSSAEDHLAGAGKKGRDRNRAGLRTRVAAQGLARRADRKGTLPLIGRVAAGNPILAAQHIEAHYRIDPALFAPRADFLLRVRGSSMKDAGILDGDLLAVHKTAEARQGQIIVARLDDEVTVKRFKRRAHEVTLLPENPEFAPIVVDTRVTPFAIEGLAVGLVRDGKRW